MHHSGMEASKSEMAGPGEAGPGKRSLWVPMFSVSPHKQWLQPLETRSWPVRQVFPARSLVLGSATSVFLCLNFHFGNSDLLTDLIKSDQDELEFPVGQTILILCNSYSCDMNQSFLHWGGSQAGLKRNLISQGGSLSLEINNFLSEARQHYM